MTLVVGSRVGPYAIGAMLGAGGMGEVWRAHDTRLGRDVALKVLPETTLADDTARSRLLREARLASHLNHPHICTVYDVGEDQGRAYIAMELVEGRPLSDMVAGPLAPDLVLRYGSQLAEALAHAHDRGVVHRDLKSANIVVTPEGQVKILDFGLARELVAGDEGAATMSRDALTAPGTIAGTPAYMAPEQLRGQRADVRSDVWALGIVLYEMAAGHRPFTGQTTFELTSAILGQPPPLLPPSVPAPIAHVVETCLDKDPNRRYQRGAEVSAALDAVRSGTAPVRPMSGRARARPFVWLAAAAIAVAVIATAVLDLGQLRSRWTRAGPAPTPAVRLAVLPLANLSGDPAQEYLSDGLTQELIAQLGRLHPESLSVIARTSVMRYKQSGTPVDQIGRELGVAYVVEGSAQREGGRIRVTAELIKVADQTQVWADSYERELAGILVLQGDVARNVAKALALRLLPAEQARLANVRQVNPEAYEAYLKASQQWIRMTPADLDAAEQYLQLALKKGPAYAPAYAGLAQVWSVRQQMGFTSPSEAGPKQRAAALKAVELDETQVDARVALATMLTWTDWNWSAAAREWERAIALNPSSAEAHAMYSHLLEITGHPEESRQHIERALALDPFSAIIQAFAATQFAFARRWDEASVQARAALRATPENPVALSVTWWVAARTGKLDDAAAAASRMFKSQYPDERVARAFDTGLARGEYRESMKRAAEAIAVVSRTFFVNPTDIAMLFVEAGERGTAIDWLEKAFDVHDANLPYIAQSIYDSLRTEPRYQALVRRMNLPVP